MSTTVRLTFLCLGLVAAATASAQTLQDPGWRAHLGAASMFSASGGIPDATLGYGVGLEYRATDRLGFAIGVASADIESSVSFDFFEVVAFTIEARQRVTPVTAQLDLHLTPNSRADFFLGPLVSYVSYGDAQLRLRGEGIDEEITRTSTEDDFAWGVHLGLNTPIGSPRMYFTARATYLRARVETLIDEEIGVEEVDLEPVVIQVGVGYRF